MFSLHAPVHLPLGFAADGKVYFHRLTPDSWLVNGLTKDMTLQGEVGGMAHCHCGKSVGNVSPPLIYCMLGHQQTEIRMYTASAQTQGSATQSITGMCTML